MVYTLQQYEYEMNRPFDGTMRTLPSKCQAHALQIELQKKREETKLLQLKQAEELRQHIEDRDAVLREILQQLQAVTNSAPISSPILPKPPDPPDLDLSDPISSIQAVPEIIKAPSLSNKLHRKYSCEELNQRMVNGLCIFCEEIDTPGHHLKKHKKSKILMVECDDEQISSATELVESVVEVVEADLSIQEVESPGAEDMIVTNKAESMEDKEEVSVTGSICVNDMIAVDMSQDEVSNPEKESSQGVLLQIQTPPYHQVLISATEQMRNKLLQSHICMDFREFRLSCHSDILPAPQMLVDVKEWAALSLKPTFLLHICEENKVTWRYEQANHVWKPGGLLSTQAHRYGLQKTLEMFIQLIKETQDWQVDKRFDLEVFSGLDQETWTALEFYGWKNMKQINPLADKSAGIVFPLKLVRTFQHAGANQIEIYGELSQKICIDVRRVVEHGRANRVWDCGGSHGAELNEYESLTEEPVGKFDSSLENKGFEKECLEFDWPLGYQCKEAVTDSKTTRIHEHVKKDVNDREGSKLKDMEAGVKKEDNGFLGDDTVILAYVAGDFFMFDFGKFKNSGLLYEKENSVSVGLGARYYAFSYEHTDMHFHKKHKWRSKRLQTASEVRAIHPSKFASPVSNVVKWKNRGTDFDAENKRLSDIEDGYLISLFAVAISENEASHQLPFARLMNIEDDIINKPITTWEVSHFQDTEYGATGHKLLSVRKIFRKGTKENSWTFMWIIVKRVSETEFEKETKTITKHLQGRSKHQDLKLFFCKNHENHELIPSETGFWMQHNDMEQLNTELHSSQGLDYFTCLIFIWNQALGCSCEDNHISLGTFSADSVHEFNNCSKLQIGNKTQGTRLLFLTVVSLLHNANKADFVVKENWFHNNPTTTEEVFHLLRPPELLKLHGYSDFFTKYSELSSLRTRMLSTREYCNRNTLVHLIYSGLWYGLFQLIGLVISFYNFGQFV